jgi:nitrate reductase NapE component
MTFRSSILLTHIADKPEDNIHSVSLIFLALSIRFFLSTAFSGVSGSIVFMYNIYLSKLNFSVPVPGVSDTIHSEINVLIGMKDNAVITVKGAFTYDCISSEISFEFIQV